VSLLRDASFQSVLRRDSPRRHTTEKKCDLGLVLNDGQLAATGNKSTVYTCLQDDCHASFRESTNRPRTISVIDLTDCRLDLPPARYTNLSEKRTSALTHISLSSVKPPPPATNQSLSSKDLISFTDDELPSPTSVADQPACEPCLRIRLVTDQPTCEPQSQSLVKIAPLCYGTVLPLHKCDSEKSLEAKLPENLTVSSSISRSLTKSLQSGFPCESKSLKSAIPFESKSPRFAISSEASSPRSNFLKVTNSPRSDISSEASSPRFFDKGSLRSGSYSPRLSGVSCNATDQGLVSLSHYY